VPIGLSDYEGIMDGMDALTSARQHACLSPASVHLVMIAPEDAHTREAVLRETTVPDGQCLVWAFQAHRQASRLYGHDLMALYCERAASRTRAGMFLYGVPRERALELLTVALCARFPGPDIVGAYPSRYRELTDPERNAVAAKINRCGADVLLVATGQPKQVRSGWPRYAAPPPILAGVGAAFGFHAWILGRPRGCSGWPRVGLSALAREAQALAPLCALYAALRRRVRREYSTRARR
jgi:N-acetylglucosaminyldiphosphoundecaprenol N-acetyl-beta-D-mannosaminyltransferase